MKPWQRGLVAEVKAQAKMTSIKLENRGREQREWSRSARCEQRPQANTSMKTWSSCDDFRANIGCCSIWDLWFRFTTDLRCPDGLPALVSHPQRPDVQKHTEGSSLFDYHRNRQDLREIRLYVYSHYSAAVSALPLMCQNGTQPAPPLHMNTHITLPPLYIITHNTLTLLKC